MSKIKIDNKEYTIEEAMQLKAELERLFPVVAPPVNIPFQNPVTPWWEHVPSIVTYSGVGKIWVDSEGIRVE